MKSLAPWALKILLCCFMLSLSARAGAARTVNFEFDGADLRTVIKAVAEFTGKNFLVDPAVKGTVTVVAPQPVTEEEAYKAFLSILEVHGYIAVESDGMTKIVPQEEGKTHETVIDRTMPDGDDMVTRVLPLRHITAESLVPVLRPLVAPYGHLAAAAAADSLIVTDRAANVERIVGIVKRLDRPANTGEMQMVPLKNASAEALARLIDKLYKPATDNRQNGNGVVITADPRTNSLIIKADAAIRKEIVSLIVELDQPMESSGDTHVVYLKNADAKNMVEVLQNIISDNAGEKPEAKLPDKVVITADPDTNSLILTASKAEYNTLHHVIKQLDIRRLQVYVEALIAEVTTEKGREYGVQWQTADGLRNNNRGVVGKTDYRVGTSITDVLLNPLAAGAGLSLGYTDGTLTLPDGTRIVNLAVLASALDSQNNINVLSTPNILTMDNQEAEIVIGQNVPFVTGSYSQINQGTAVNNPFQTIERKDVGLTLRIKPQITEGSAIKLDIYQEVSGVAQKGEAFDIVTNTRSLSTTIVAEDGRTVVLGGLIQDDITKNVQKVPLLGDIPLLGNLFRYKKTGHKKTNLLIFLRPKIVRSFADMEGPTKRKYEYLDKLPDLRQLRRQGGMPSSLDEWELITPVHGKRSGTENKDAARGKQ